MSPQFIRFVAAGGTAAVANIASRWLLSFVMSFEIAIVIAYLIGMLVAFVLTKLFVFEPSNRHTGSEMVRFTIINLIALAQVWLVSVGLADWVFPAIGLRWHAETIAHVIGVASPIATSYIGHKRYTFG